VDDLDGLGDKELIQSALRGDFELIVRLWVPVGGGDVGVAVQTQEADGQATCSDAITRDAFPVLASDCPPGR
jgi:hypothetical protein